MSHLNEVNLRFDMFGVEFLNADQFRLYPKLFTEDMYSNYKVPLASGVTADLMLFSPSSSNNSTSKIKGLMVKDNKCFSKLTDLFKSVKLPLKLEIQDSNSVPRNVFIYGSILEV